MYQLLVTGLSSKPVKEHLAEWLHAARQLHRAGQYLETKLLLETVLQAANHNLKTHVLLVETLLALGNALEALQVARHAAQVCSLNNVSTGDQARSQLVLGLALGSVARTTIMSQGERSKHRSEARSALQQAAQQSGSHRVASLYALALTDAEDGYYETAIQHAQDALEAAAGDAETCAPIVALIALLLTARQQLQAAVEVTDAGLSSLPTSSITGELSATAAAATAATADTTARQVGLPRCYDILLLRVKAQLHLAVGDVNTALAVLGSARRRLANARSAVSDRGGSQTAAAAERLVQLEAQVWRDLALAYASQQQPSDAQMCVQQMQQLEPHTAASYHAVGCVAAAAGNGTAAKAAYKAALALDAAYPPALLGLGALLQQQGDAHNRSVALGLLSDALRYEPHNHMGWHHLGLAQRQQGHIADAERHLCTAVTLAAAAPVLSYSQLPPSL